VAASRARLDSLLADMHDALAPFVDRAAVLAELGRQAIERNR
jgi:farnesyl diphosphate synthase